MGQEAGAPGPDGALARRTYLDPGPDLTRANDPGLTELLKRQAALEAQIEEVKLRKGAMPEDEYQRTLERLLVELATVSKQIRARQP